MTSDLHFRANDAIGNRGSWTERQVSVDSIFEGSDELNGGHQI